MDQNFAKAEILAVDGKPLKTIFSGIIFKESIRSYDIEGLEILKCFKPNDIIRARVVS